MTHPRSVAGVRDIDRAHFEHVAGSMNEHMLRTVLRCWPHATNCELMTPSFLRSGPGVFGPCSCDRSGAFNEAMLLLRRMDDMR